MTRYVQVAGLNNMQRSLSFRTLIKQTNQPHTVRDAERFYQKYKHTYDELCIFLDDCYTGFSYGTPVRKEEECGYYKIEVKFNNTIGGKLNAKKKKN